MALEDPEFDIERFYVSRYVEDDRLRKSPHGRLEFVRTQELLRRFLPPPPARVLDVGGGTGVHARWLGEDGYDVHLVDVVGEHVEHAKAIGGVSVEIGDARALRQPADWADAVLLLGPLYHLTASADRARALAEARRVVRGGGLVAVAAISRYASLLDLATRGVLDDQSLTIARETMRTGLHDPRLGFTTAYFHTADELAAELETAGYRDIQVFGVEGPSSGALDARGLEDMDAYLSSAVACAREVECDPELMAASPHLLAVGRAP